MNHPLPGTVLVQHNRRPGPLAWHAATGTMPTMPKVALTWPYQVESVAESSSHDSKYS